MGWFTAISFIMFGTIIAVDLIMLAADWKERYDEKRTQRASARDTTRP